jgi:cobalt-zinc-cadmium efflux system protein
MNHQHSHDHDHHHDHDHDHHDHSLGGHSHAHHAPQSFNLAFAIAVGLNLLFTLFQIAYAYIANSMGLLADAAHNFGDVFGLVLAWGANWLLTLPARKRYSYGYKRTTILAALSNAIILVASSAIISYESIYKLFNLSHVNGQIVIIVALIGIVINGGTALLFMRGAHEDLNIKGAFLHLIGDALVSIGVVIGGILILWTGWMWVDPILGLLIVAIILIGTWGLLRDSVRLILDAIPRNVDPHAVEDFFKKISGVTAVHDLHIWGLSTKEVALTVHLVMPEQGLSDADFEKINSVLKERFKINHVTIQVETGHKDFPCARSEIC